MHIVLQSVSFAVLLLLHAALFGDSAPAETSAAREERAIVGGVKAGQGQFPFAVCIKKYDRDPTSYKQWCTGSLITTQSVLTAGHCAYGNNDRRLKVKKLIGVVGSVDHRKGESVKFKEALVHPNINLALAYTDIAVFVLKEPVTLGGSIKTIPLAGTYLNEVGKRGILLGWGDTTNKEAPVLLRYVRVDVTSLGTCEETYGNMRGDEICFGTAGRGGNTGDSGGPLIIQYENRVVQIGLFSYNDNVGLKGSPNVGMNVSAHKDWLTSNVVGEVEFVGKP